VFLDWDVCCLEALFSRREGISSGPMLSNYISDIFKILIGKNRGTPNLTSRRSWEKDTLLSSLPFSIDYLPDGEVAHGFLQTSGKGEHALALLKDSLDDSFFQGNRDGFAHPTSLLLLTIPLPLIPNSTSKQATTKSTKKSY
jgi:hypothetical protein